MCVKGSRVQVGGVNFFIMVKVRVSNDVGLREIKVRG